MEAIGAQSSPRRIAGSNVARSRLRAVDVFRVGSVGMRTRKLRTGLTAVGIGIGIAALVAVMGISASSRADLLAQINALGPNRLQVQAGSSFTPGSTPVLNEHAIAMIRRIEPVRSATGITTVTATVRRSDRVAASETGGISIAATDEYFATATGAKLAWGRFLDVATVRYPAVVLGATAAQRLGLSQPVQQPKVYISGNWFVVLGVLENIPLLPNLDTAAFIGFPVATELFASSTSPSIVYVETELDAVDSVESVLAATANPESPGEVAVSRPSDAIKAKEAIDSTLTALLLGLGGVALLVGGIGIANVMVISVLERRTEIGVRRALGATKRHVRLQFLVEAVLLSGMGGILGVALGVGVTVAYANTRDIVLSIPAASLAIGVGAALAVGGLAGLSPAGRAAKLAPADAIRPA
jgi:putative ABC transport system permease protein